MRVVSWVCVYLDHHSHGAGMQQAQLHRERIVWCVMDDEMYAGFIGPSMLSLAVVI